MIHARQDYNRFQDPALTDPSLLGEGSTPIAEDEPVFLLRAKDKHFIATLGHYVNELAADVEVTYEMVEAVRAHMTRAYEWQQENEPKAPDMP